VKKGDVEFCVSSSANAATPSPQAGVMSMHFLFRSEAHLIKAIADPGVVDVAENGINVISCQQALRGRECSVSEST